MSGLPKSKLTRFHFICWRIGDAENKRRPGKVFPNKPIKFARLSDKVKFFFFVFLLLVLKFPRQDSPKNLIKN